MSLADSHKHVWVVVFLELTAVESVTEPLCEANTEEISVVYGLYCGPILWPGWSLLLTVMDSVLLSRNGHLGQPLLGLCRAIVLRVHGTCWTYSCVQWDVVQGFDNQEGMK